MFTELDIQTKEERFKFICSNYCCYFYWYHKLIIATNNVIISVKYIIVFCQN